MKPRTKYAKSGGLNIAYQVLGEGSVDLILSPGWVTHLELAWEVPPLARFLERLASFSRLILFDKRGTGLSDRIDPDRLPSLSDRMDDIRVVMDAVGSERAVLFGTLGGGAMCGLFAATYPERSVALILYGTFPKLEPETGMLSRLANTEEEALDRIENEWGTEGVGVAFWAPNLLVDERTTAAYLQLTRSGLSPGSARALMQLGYQIDWGEVLPRIEVPTLVIHRTGDLVVPVHQGRTLAEGIKGARYVELPGVDHLMWVGDQDAIVDEVRRFLLTLLPSTQTRSRRVSPDELGLSARELEVLQLVATGRTNKQIADQLFHQPEDRGDPRLEHPGEAGGGAAGGGGGPRAAARSTQHLARRGVVESTDRRHNDPPQWPRGNRPWPRRPRRDSRGPSHAGGQTGSTARVARVRPDQNLYGVRVEQPLGAPRPWRASSRRRSTRA